MNMNLQKQNKKKKEIEKDFKMFQTFNQFRITYLYRLF